MIKGRPERILRSMTLKIIPNAYSEFRSTPRSSIIKSETMLDKRRIYDRILEMCTPMYVGGTSKREAIASMKMEKAKTLLNTNRGEEKCE